MQSDSITIVRVGPGDVERVAPLFDMYRQFYEQTGDSEGALAFIRERLDGNESVIFLALNCEGGGDEAAGFVQLYPIFSSVRMIRTWLLNDLYVHPDHRTHGVGRLLMDRSIAHARDTGYGRVELATASDNFYARNLYESLGFEREEGFEHYSLSV